MNSDPAAAVMRGLAAAGTHVMWRMSRVVSKSAETTNRFRYQLKPDRIGVVSPELTFG